MSETPVPVTSSTGFNDQADRGPDRIVIAGCGMAAIFTAYQLLKNAENAGKPIDVVLVADRINAPCAAGSHCVLSVDGLYEDIPAGEALKPLLRGGMAALQETVKAEGIACSLQMGYEIKGNAAEVVANTRALMLQYAGYREDELTINTDSQGFNLAGYGHSLHISSIGQVNTPDLLAGLLNKINQMGGRIITGARFESTTPLANGQHVVKLDDGSTLFATHKPLVATGVEHQRTLPGFNFEGNTVYTMGMVIGPLSEEDARRVSPKGPMAMCNTDLTGDVIWGGLDDRNNLTIGFGDNPDPHAVAETQARVLAIADKMFPGIVDKYPHHVSYGAMFETANGMPVVGRLPTMDVMGGWGGRGIVAGMAAAKAYADWILNGNDAQLKIFESLQPEGFANPAPARGAGADPAARVA